MVIFNAIFLVFFKCFRPSKPEFQLLDLDTTGRLTRTRTRLRRSNCQPERAILKQSRNPQKAELEVVITLLISSSHYISEANNLFTTPPSTAPAGYIYMKVMLLVERKGVTTLRSVAEILKKRIVDTLKRIAMYRSLIEDTNTL